VCCTTANLWAQPDVNGAQSSSDVFAITPDYAARVHQPSDDAYKREHVYDSCAMPKRVPISAVNEYLPIRDGMAISSAVLAYAMGDGTLSVKSGRPLMTLFGFGMGEWIDINSADAAGLGSLAFYPRLFMYHVMNAVTMVWFLVALRLHSPLFLIGMPIGLVVTVFLLKLIRRLVPNSRFFVPMLTLPSFQVVAQGLALSNSHRARKLTNLFLSDGGFLDLHGLMPLLQARTSRIIALDTTGDPDFDLEALKATASLARRKLGVSFHMDKEKNEGFESALMTYFRTKYWLIDAVDKNGHRVTRKMRPRFVTFYVRYPPKVPCGANQDDGNQLPPPLKEDWGMVTLFKTQPRIEQTPQLTSVGEGVGPRPTMVAPVPIAIFNTSTAITDNESPIIPLKTVVTPLAKEAVPSYSGQSVSSATNYRTDVGDLADNRQRPEFKEYVEHLKRGHGYAQGLVPDQDDVNLDKITHGMACECCGSWSALDQVIGKFPYAILANQFFTPKQFDAYHHEGFLCALNAFEGLSEEEKKKDLLFSGPGAQA